VLFVLDLQQFVANCSNAASSSRSNCERRHTRLREIGAVIQRLVFDRQIQGAGILGRECWFKEIVMNYGNIHSWSVNRDRRIALALRRDPKLLGLLEHRLRSKMATAKSAAAVGENDWEWYVILTLWSPLKVIRLLEDSGERAARLRKTSPLLSLLSDFEKGQLPSLNFSG
jgi:hypothetical protein